MGLSHASFRDGIRVYIYVKGAKGAWENDPASRYRVRRRGQKVFTITVPPNSNISRSNHLRIIQRLFPMAEKNETLLDNFDKAGPHSGELIKEAYRCSWRVPACPDHGGWTGESQFLDSHVSHGHMKNDLADHSTDHFISEGKRLENERHKKPNPISLDQLCQWLDQWCVNHGTAEMVRSNMPRYYPPLPGKPDERRENIKNCFKLIREKGPVEMEKEKKIFKRDTDIINVRGVGEVTAAEFNRLGVLTVGDLLDEEKKLPEKVVRLKVATAVQYCNDVMSGRETDPFQKTPATCQRCGMTYSGAGKLFREHCQRNDRCFYRLEKPYVPRFKGSNPNNPQTYNPTRRQFYFNKKEPDGSLVRCKGVFLNEAASRIKYQKCAGQEQAVVFNGAWNQLIWNKLRYVRK
ncbi:MAG: hypothetical protein NPIRA05_21590 [Nitrospirales bacterium]|nr:MAG: hypothetical protein NPIRA05_21590 [Nitrospirales bacterium]